MKKNKKTLKERFTKVIRSEGFKKFKKILDWIVYLYALILTIVLIVGISMPKQNNDQSNNNRKSSDVSERLDYDLDFFDVYELNYIGGHSLTLAEQQQLTKSAIIFDNAVSSSQSITIREENLNGFYLMDYNDNLISIDILQATYQSYQYSEGVYFYRLREFGFIHENIEYYRVCIKSNESVYAFHYTFTYSSNEIYRQVLVDNRGIFDSLTKFDLNVLYHYCEVQDFYFSNLLRVNTPLGHDSTGLIIADGRFDGSSSSISITWTLPTFISNGELYDTIVFNYVMYYEGQSVTPCTHVEGVGNVALGVNQGVFASMIYRNSITNRFYNVFVRDSFIVASLAGNQRVYTNDFHWTINDLRNLKFLQPLTKNQLNALVLLNNGIDDSTIETPNQNQDLDDIISIIKKGFEGLLGVLNIQLLPSISLGLLLFIPLLVTIIVIVVRMVKK